MEDRYEIRGKIGQGGLGAVYRGYDTRMHREVAVKRISTAGGDAELQAESTRQLIKEAGALASLQHPHIVTVYDVGSDEDGPYVVMELISGKTLDELIGRAPLTWQDFRELAMQTQEALIAAQELNLIHSDLKPSNLMLTWLPSGKFQVKVVDFGLATLAQSQTSQDMEAIDAVFGSVFFMPPEQFERAPLDARSDIYSMGCVYYQALTGIYPFDGKTGNEVMGSHLHHTVKPINEVRAGVPMWACEWIMWQINRFPQDRPASSREALSIFLKNDRIANSPLSLGVPKPVIGPPRARLVIPGSGPAPRRQAASTPVAAQAALVQTAQVATMINEGGPITQTAPQPLAPPEGFKPSVHTDLQVLPAATPTHGAAEPGHHASAATGTKRNHSAGHRVQPAVPRSKSSKIVMGVVAAMLLVSAAFFGQKFFQIKREAGILSALLAESARPGATTVKIDAASLRVLLEAMVKPESEPAMQSIGKVLTLAEASDGTDVDARIADFAIKRADLSLGARETLLGSVLRTRNHPAVMPVIMEFAATSKDIALVTSALQAVRQMADDAQFNTFLQLIETTDDSEIRVAAELNIEEILRKSKNVDTLAKQLATARESTLKPDIQKTLRRLQSVCESLKR